MKILNIVKNGQLGKSIKKSLLEKSKRMSIFLLEERS